MPVLMLPNGRDIVRNYSFSIYTQFSKKTNISYSVIRIRTFAYQRVRNVSFSENFAYVLNGKSLMEN